MAAEQQPEGESIPAPIAPIYPRPWDELRMREAKIRICRIFEHIAPDQLPFASLIISAAVKLSSTIAEAEWAICDLIRIGAIEEFRLGKQPVPHGMILSERDPPAGIEVASGILNIDSDEQPWGIVLLRANHEKLAAMRGVFISNPVDAAAALERRTEIISTAILLVSQIENNGNFTQTLERLTHLLPWRGPEGDGAGPMLAVVADLSQYRRGKAISAIAQIRHCVHALVNPIENHPEHDPEAIADQMLKAIEEIAPRRNLTHPVEPEHEQSLTTTENAVLSILKKLPQGRGNTAKEIIAALKAQGVDLKKSTLQRHVIPRLKESHGVVNHGAAGGYLIPAQSQNR